MEKKEGSEGSKGKNLSRELHSLPILTEELIQVCVRWWDAYFEEFAAVQVRFGSDLLWIRTKEGNNRHIPLRHVRWFSVYPESHEEVYGMGSD